MATRTDRGVVPTYIARLTRIDPAKFGIVGGGILAVVPGIGAIAMWPPGLNSHGNSRLGTFALEALRGR